MLTATVLRALLAPVGWALDLLIPPEPEVCVGHPAIDTAYRDSAGVWRCVHCALPIEEGRLL